MQGPTFTGVGIGGPELAVIGCEIGKEQPRRVTAGPYRCTRRLTRLSTLVDHDDRGVGVPAEESVKAKRPAMVPRTNPCGI